MRKFKYILILLFVVIFGIIIIYKSINNNYSDNNAEISSSVMSKEQITIQNSPISIIEITKLILNKNSDWSNLPLSDNFKNKYNNKDGVLGNIQFDKVEISPYHDGKYPFEDYAYFVITQGNKKTAYEYDFKIDSTGQLLDDIKIIDVHNITDEYGNELDSRVAINEENFNRAFYMLSRGAEDERSIAVTDRFHSKYPYFLDLFEHYSPLEFNRIEYVSDKSSWERKEAYFIVDSRLECKKREYIVNFTLDDRGYLDDVVVKRVREEEYENEEHDGGLHIFYINSNWEGLNLTDNFRSKFNYKKGVFPDINTLGYNFSFSNENNYKQVTIDGIAKVNQIRAFKINGRFVYYSYQVFKDENGYIDNVIYNKLPYSNITIEEAKELYIKEHSN